MFFCEIWKNFKNAFSTEHLHWLLLSKETPTQVFACESCEIFRDTCFYRLPPVAGSEWTLLSCKSNMTFCWFLACFKDIFDSRILFPELVAQRKHYLFGFDAIQSFLSKQYFCLLITTVQNIYISNETSQKERLLYSFKRKNSWIN